ncbi:MAG: VanZ family protein [bacterium]|nr:VanZ family protein [bacterium]
MLKKIIKLSLVIVWMFLIFSFSSDTGKASTKKSDGVIISTVQFFKGRELTAKEKEKYINFLVVPVRKGAHFLVYFILAILIISFLNEFMDINKKCLFLALFLAFLYACSDEIHQLMVAGRSGQVSDVLLDTFSAGCGIICYRLFYKKRREKSK